MQSEKKRIGKAKIMTDGVRAHQIGVLVVAFFPNAKILLIHASVLRECIGN